MAAPSTVASHRLASTDSPRPAILTPSFDIPRRKLPWLNNAPSIDPKPRVPGAFESKESLSAARNTTDAQTQPDAVKTNDTAANLRPSRIPALSSDLAFREIGSTPSMQTSKAKNKTFIPRRLSLDTELRAGLRPFSSKADAKSSLTGANTAEDSSLSEYSTTMPSEKGKIPAGLSKRHPQSYERLVEQAAKNSTRSRDPLRFTQRWLQSELDLPLDNVSDEAIPDTAGESGDPFDRRTVREQAIARRQESSSRPPRLQRDRRQTLHELPPHLTASSSSSPSSPHITYPEPAFRSPPLSPRTITTRAAVNNSGGLRRAAAELDALMDDATNVAQSAARNGQSDDVATILQHAADALRKASTINQRGSQPLVLSPHESDDSQSSTDSSDIYSDASSPVHSRDASAETVPTLLSKGAQPSQQTLYAQPFEKAETKKNPFSSPSRSSITQTPPRLYQPASVDSIVRDFAYAKLRNDRAQKAESLNAPSGLLHGAAEDYYGDTGQSVATQPGVRKSIARAEALPKPRTSVVPSRDFQHRARRPKQGQLRALEPVPTDSAPSDDPVNHKKDSPDGVPQRRPARKGKHHHISDFFENAYYHVPEKDDGRRISTVTDSSAPNAHLIPTQNLSLKHPRRKHISLREGQGFSLGRYHRRQPIAREWHTVRKRITAAIACFNTVFVGLIAGIYAGEVPRIQYTIADISHKVILGNVLLFLGLGLTTAIFWPLPLLHGRKPYTLMAFALMLPLQFPQALSVSAYRDPGNPLYRCGLLIPRLFTGVAMGFANINQLPTLFDLFGVSLMSERPHEEIVVYDDVRRQGGGVGIWLGIWSFCFVGSLSIGFCAGACIISTLDPAWGFYIIVILLAVFMLINVVVPETRRAPYRRSIAHFLDDDEKLRRRVARGEVKLHISNEGPRWWFQEVWAGIILSKRMLVQPGFFVLNSYIAWIYCQVTLVVLLLGALLSRDYRWRPQYVGLAVLALAVGALFAIPLAKASLFSRSRYTPQRTDSMTMRTPRLTWTSHLARRCVFTLLLPFAGLAFTLSSPGRSVSWAAPTIFAGLVGFLSNLAIAECVGIIMEIFDTCDLQPGVNQRHRLQSMAETTRRRRTNYSSFPRVCAGFFCAQSLGFFLAAAATGVSGTVTRALGAQTSTSIVAAILLVITLLLMLALFRFSRVQVVPNGAGPFSSTTANRPKTDGWDPSIADPDWKPVVIGNPSGKMRRVNLLELGNLSRWTEIRRLNKLIK